MAAYRLEWKRSALKDLHRIARKDVIRIVQSVEREGGVVYALRVLKVEGLRAGQNGRAGGQQGDTQEGWQPAEEVAADISPRILQA